MRINREQFNKWIKALRSGRYKQTTNKLQNENGYCCLGVLCKVVIPKNKLNLSGKYINGAFPSDQPNAPKWVKQVENQTFNIGNDRIKTLSLLNDSEDYTFKQIADVLVKAYPERKKKK